jgi:hypothetical protein
MMLSKSWNIASVKATRPMHIFGRHISGAARAAETPLLRKQTEDGLGAALFSFEA